MRDRSNFETKIATFSHKILGSVKPSHLRQKFENLAKQSEEEVKKRKDEEQERRRLRDLQEKKEAEEREKARLSLLNEKEKEVMTRWRIS